MTATELDGHDSLEILASAIAGRAVQVAAADAGARTWTDGSTIFLDGDAGPRDRLRLLAVQASLLAAGSLGADVVAELRRGRSLASRYLAGEGHRALAANEEFLPPWMRSMIDRSVADRLGSPQDSLRWARDARGLEPPWVFGSIEPRKVTSPAERTTVLLAVGPGSAGPVQGDDAAVLQLLDDDDPAGLDLGNLLSSPVGGGGAVGRLLAKLLRPGRAGAGGGPPGADAPTHVTWTRPGNGRTMVSRPVAGAGLGDVEHAATVARSYPEWDEHQRRYRPDWCLVVDDRDGDDSGALGSLPDPVALRRALARLGLGLIRCRRRRQGDDIDIDAAVEARVDLLAGAPHEDDVYIESLRRRRDLSVLVLLDVSGSAAEPGLAGRPVHEHQRDAAAALTTALHDLGDRVALHAFSSRGRRAVHVRTLKGFDDRLDGRVAAQLDRLRPGAYTRLGAAIRHGTALLDERSGTPRRLLVVLSDGLAYDHGYEGRYGEADAHRALVEARRRGIGCLCLSVGTDADVAALRRVFGAAAHAAVPSVAQLPSLIGPLFASALGSAEAQRRRYQRTHRTRERLELESGAR